MSQPIHRRLSLTRRHNIKGWFFLTPAALLIACMSFLPIIKAFVLSFKTGSTFKRMKWYGILNYNRMFSDTIFIKALRNTFVYLIIQVPIMLILALVLASMLNSRDLKLRGLFRTAIFLPCATSLVSYAIIFRALFATDGFINNILIKLGIIDTGYGFLTHPMSARIVIIIALIWRWTGYNMVFYLSGLQNIEYSIYEQAKIDGASPAKIFWKITCPLLKPTILLTAIMSTNGTLQLFDESVNLTNGGPANSTITMSHYIYNCSFKYVANFGYSSAMSFLVLIMVAVLAYIQMRVGDKRD